MQKYMITGSTGADVRSFFPRFIVSPVHDNLNDAKQHALDLIDRDLQKFEKTESGFKIKTGDFIDEKTILSLEIVDRNGNSWDRIQVKVIDD